MTSQLEVNNETFIFTNIYSPCDSDNNKIAFLNYLQSHVSNLLENSLIKTNNYVLLGDFNTVMNNDMDIISGNKHSERVITKFNEVINFLGLADYFRLTNPFLKTFTWSRKKTQRGKGK